MKTIDTLVDDIFAVLDVETDHEPDEANVQAAGEAFKDLLRTRLRVDPEPRDPLRFSSLGKNERQLWYQSRMPEKGEKLDPRTVMKFLYGDVIELLLVFLTKEAGHTVTHEQHEVTLDGVLGHVDAVVDGVLVDFKSASPFAFNKFKSGGLLFDDPFAYIPQLSGYNHALRAEFGGDIDGSRAAFVVADKVSGDICVSFLDKETIDGNPPGPRIEYLKKVLACDDRPRCCATEKPDGKSGNMKLDMSGSYCSFKRCCFPDLREFKYSTGSRYLTHVKRQPDVEEV